MATRTLATKIERRARRERRKLLTAQADTEARAAAGAKTPAQALAHWNKAQALASEADSLKVRRRRNGKAKDPILDQLALDIFGTHAY